MSKQTPPLYALRAFDVAARHCSFTQAANELSLTQSAISRHIRTLEDILGHHLFERNGPKLSLTDQGRILAEELKLGFLIIERACLSFKEYSQAIRLKVPSTLASRWLIKASNLFESEHPDTPLKLSSVWMETDTINFSSEPYDCAILLSDGYFSADYHCFKLFDEQLIPICTPSYCSPAHQLIIHDLENIKTLHSSSDQREWKKWLEAQNLTTKINIKHALEFDTLDQCIFATLQGIGISVTDLRLVSSELENGIFYSPFPTAISSGKSYYMVWQKNTIKEKLLLQLKDFLLMHLPVMYTQNIKFLD